MSDNFSKNKLFDDKSTSLFKQKYANQPRWLWSIAAEFVIDPYWNIEREILECIYNDYPNCSHKKHIKKDLLSSNKDTSWGAWAELRTYDWLRYKGMKLEPEPPLGRDKPDFLVKYPVGDDIFNELYIEVTAVRAECDLKFREENKIKQILTKLNEVAVTTDLHLHVCIPISNFPLPSQIDYVTLQNDFIDQLSKLKNHPDKRLFDCQTNNLNVKILIQNIAPKTEGCIIDYSLDFEGEQKELEQFVRRVYQSLETKIGTYNELDNLNTPFIVVMFIKGLFSIMAFKKAIVNIVNLEKEANVLSCRRLSGIALCTTTTRPDGGFYLIERDYIYFPYPNAKCSIDHHFINLIDAEILSIIEN